MISDSIPRGISARGGIYKRYRKTNEGYTKIKGMVQYLITIPLIQIVFGGWSPAEERLTEFQKNTILKTTRGKNIKKIYLITGINSIRGFLFEEKPQTENQRRITINRTCEGIRIVVDALRKFFPKAEISYLGTSKLLMESSFPGLNQVNRNLKERNEDLIDMREKLEMMFWKRNLNETKQKHQTNKKPEFKPPIQVVDVFTQINDDHIKDLCGHLSPVGDEHLASMLNALMEQKQQ